MSKPPAVKGYQPQRRKLHKAKNPATVSGETVNPVKDGIRSFDPTETNSPFSYTGKVKTSHTI